MHKKMNLLFMGNDGNLINELISYKGVRLIGVVADSVTGENLEYFGSSRSIGIKCGLPVISQGDFNKNYSKYLNSVFGEVNLIFIQGYRYRVKSDLLARKGIKIINFHQSLLPDYAGRHPLNWAIVKGEKATGITFHYLNREFDSGDIIFQERINIGQIDDIISLYNKSILVAKRRLRMVLKLVKDPLFRASKQDLRRYRYFPPRTFRDGRILRADSKADVCNKVRALKPPYPGAYVYFNNRVFRVGRASVVRGGGLNLRPDAFISQVGRNLYLRAADGILKIEVD